MNQLVTEFDSFSAVREEGITQNDVILSRWADRLLIFSLMLFAASVPHSIAASNLSLGLTVLSWFVRDALARRIHWRSTPLDRALFCFAALTILSSLLSEARDISLPKLKSLTLFLILYVVAVNVSKRGVTVLFVLLIASGLTGVAFSLVEKIIGRGVIVTAIRAESPLAKTHLQSGDVIWMLNRKRVSSLSDITTILSNLSAGQKVEIQALHNGDPLPLELIVTEELKHSSDALGIEVGGRSRRFRVSGFSRQFLTYAEQMQILGLLVFGVMLANLKAGEQSKRWLTGSVIVLAFFSAALVMTVSRAVLASFLLSIVLVAALAAGKRVALLALAGAMLIGSLGIYLLITNRSQSAALFGDDSSSRRIGYMKAGLRIIPQHPLLGVGMDSHKRFWREWNFPGDYITHTHSTLIQIALDRGLLTLGCYVWLMVTAMLTAWRGYRKMQADNRTFSAGIALGAFAALLGFNVSSLVNYNFGDSELALLLWLIAGWMLVQERESVSTLSAW